MAAAVKAFIERQGIQLPVAIEPILLAANPGLHIESAKPAVRVMMIDGLKPFATGLATAKRVLSAEAVHEFTERIVNPRPVRKGAIAPADLPRPAWEEEKTQPPPGQQVSRARAIFDASEEAKPFNPADFDFAMVDEEAAIDSSTPSQTDSASDDLPRRTSQRQRVLGMTSGQLAVLAGLGIALLMLAAVFVYLVLTSSPLLP
jgi:hypothetical protein